MNLKRTGVRVTFSNEERILCREMADFISQLRDALEDENAVSISDYEGDHWTWCVELSDFLTFCERVSDEKKAEQDWKFIYD